MSLGIFGISDEVGVFSIVQVAIMIGSSVFTLLCKKFTVESFMRFVSFLGFFVKSCYDGLMQGHASDCMARRLNWFSLADETAHATENLVPLCVNTGACFVRSK